MAMSFGMRDQMEIRKYYKKFLTMQESYYLSVEIQKWKNYYENKILPLRNGLQMQIRR